MDWNKVSKCHHEWSETYADGGTCPGAEGCTWSETRCKKCGVYEVTCKCGCENGSSGEPRKRWNERLRKRLAA